MSADDPTEIEMLRAENDDLATEAEQLRNRIKQLEPYLPANRAGLADTLTKDLVDALDANAWSHDERVGFIKGWVERVIGGTEGVATGL